MAVICFNGWILKAMHVIYKLYVSLQSSNINVILALLMREFEKEMHLKTVQNMIG